MDIPADQYLHYSLEFTPREIELRDEIVEWLPERVIDCHAHCNLRSHVEYVNERAARHMASTFPYYSLEDAIAIKRLMYGNRNVRTLRFPKIFKGLDHYAANAYLLEESPKHDRVAIFGLPEDIPYTLKMLHHPRCSALKMYWSYVDPPAERIYDFFLPEILEEAQCLNIPIILHLPKMIVRSLEDLKGMLLDFPRLRVVIAHLGLSKMLVPGLVEVFDLLKPYENVMLDTALNPSSDVVSVAIRCVGAERIMFGSDEPVNLIRSVVFDHPTKGQRLATEYPYHWVDPAEHAEFKHLAAGVTHSHWQAIGALKESIDSLSEYERERTKKLILHDNAYSFFGF